MKIIRAEHLGMCFGVRDAINLALTQSQAQPLTVLGDLVHNEWVFEGLQARGIKIAQHAANVETKAVMITAHGASEKAMQDVRGRNLNVIKTTYPLIHITHQTITNLVR